MENLPTARSLPSDIPTSILTDLYPNPVSKNSLFVRMEEFPPNTRFLVSSMDGQVHLNISMNTKARSNTYEISVDKLPAGIYLLNIMNGKGKSLDRLRFVKQ
jgi:hypothetical protein